MFVFAAIALTLLAVPGVTALSTLTGCSGMNQRSQYATVNDGFIAVCQTVQSLHDGGKISETTYKRDVWPLVNQGNLLLREYDTISQTPEPPPGDALAARKQKLQELKLGINAVAQGLNTWVAGHR